jgi:hypothetical protein
MDNPIITSSQARMSATIALIPHAGRVQGARRRKSLNQKIAELYVDESIVREVEEEDNPIIGSDTITIYL